MMLEWFHPGQLPMGTKYNRAQTDVSNYRSIYNAARSIETACTVSKSPGWLMTGKIFPDAGPEDPLIMSRQGFSNGGVRVADKL